MSMHTWCTYRSELCIIDLVVLMIIVRDSLYIIKRGRAIWQSHSTDYEWLRFPPPKITWNRRRMRSSCTKSFPIPEARPPAKWKVPEAPKVGKWRRLVRSGWLAKKDQLQRQEFNKQHTIFSENTCISQMHLYTVVYTKQKESITVMILSALSAFFTEYLCLGSGRTYSSSNSCMLWKRSLSCRTETPLVGNKNAAPKVG